jgi:hypothetical protein
MDRCLSDNLLANGSGMMLLFKLPLSGYFEAKPFSFPQPYSIPRKQMFRVFLASILLYIYQSHAFNGACEVSYYVVFIPPGTQTLL